MSGYRCPLLMILLVALTACAREAQQVTLTAEEQRLLSLLTVDSFIEVMSYERDMQGRLVVRTRQGDTRARYLFAAAPGGPLDIHRLDDQVTLPVADDGSKGTGPDPRGLR
jgi:hypothetical protein